MDIRIAGAQIPVSTNIQKNKQELFKAIDWAKENKVQHLLTPEGSSSGWLGWETKIEEVKDALEEVEAHQKDVEDIQQEIQQIEEEVYQEEVAARMQQGTKKIKT